MRRSQLPPYDEMIGEVILHIAKEAAGVIDVDFELVDWLIARFAESRKRKRNV